MLDDADLHGVALAAIQGLNQKLEADMKAKDEEIQNLREEASQVNELKQRLSAIEQLLKSNRSQNHEN
jgi:cell shape-determining protein MreC